MDFLSFRKKQLDSLFKTINLIVIGKEDEVPKEEKLKQAEELIQKLIQIKSQTMLDLETRKGDQDYIALRLDRYRWERRNLVHYDRLTLHAMRQALDEELKQSTPTPKEKYKMFHKLCQQIKHGNNNLVEERRILRAIQHAKEQSEKPSSGANGRKRPWKDDWRYGRYIPIPNSVEEIEDKIKRTLSELQELQKKQKSIIANEEMVKKDLEKAERKVCLLRKQLDVINKKERTLYAYIVGLKRQSEGEI